MFSIVRQKNGYNKNPTARMFRSCFANICSFSLMKCSEKCNCEEDNDEYLTLESLENINLSFTHTQLNEENILNKDDEDEQFFSDSSSTSSSTTPTLNNNTATLETCSIFYFVGFLAKKFINFFNCTHCKKNL